MKLWIITLFAVLSSCSCYKAQLDEYHPEDAIRGRFAIDYDAYFDELKKGQVEAVKTLGYHLGASDEGDHKSALRYASALSKENSAEENYKHGKDVRKFLADVKSDTVFKDYQFEDNRSGHQENKKLSTEETMLKPDYVNDNEEFDGKSVKIPNILDISDAFVHLGVDEMSKVMEDKVHMSAQIDDDHSNSVDNVKNSSLQEPDEDIPSAPIISVFDKKLIDEAKNLLIDSDDSEQQNETKAALGDSQEQSKERFKGNNIETGRDSKLRLGSVEIKISKEDFEKYLNDNKDLNDDLKTLHKTIDEMKDTDDIPSAPKVPIIDNDIVLETNKILKDNKDLNEDSKTYHETIDDMKDTDDIPSVPKAPIIDKDIVLETNKLLNEATDTLDATVMNDIKGKIAQTNKDQPMEMLDEIVIKDVQGNKAQTDESKNGNFFEDILKTSGSNEDVDKAIDSIEDELAYKEDYETLYKRNNELDMSSLFKDAEDIAYEYTAYDDVPEVDFDKMFDDNVYIETKTHTDARQIRNDKRTIKDSDVNDNLGTVLEKSSEKLTDQIINGSTTVKTLKVEELSSQELQDVIDEFSAVHEEELDYQSENFDKDVAPVYVKLTADDVVTVTSPGYPDPYPDNNIVDWIFEVDGKGIELNITDFDVNGALGDYLLIKPGGLEDASSNGIIVTHHLNTARRYRFSNVDKMFVRFEAKTGMTFKRGFSFDVKTLFPSEENNEAVTEPPILPPPVHTLTVNLGGLALPQFLEIQEEFRLLLADMATLYINSNGIEAMNTTSSVTQIISSSLCNLNWPNAESCVQVRFSVPVLQTEEESRLNEEDLSDMWLSYVYMDPFATRLRLMGINNFSVPRTSAMLSVWLVIGAGVMISMTMLAFVLWRYSCVEDYTRMHNPRNSGSSVNEKRPLDLYPTPHQTLPPLYSDQYKYSYENTAAVDMDGFRNQGYAQDDLFDIDSDDDVKKRERYTTDV